MQSRTPHAPRTRFALGTFSHAGCPPFAGLVLDGTRVVAVEALRTLCGQLGHDLPPASSTLALLEHWNASHAALEAAADALSVADSVASRAAADHLVPMTSLKVHPPVASRQIFMSGANYFKHVVDIIVDLGAGKTPGTEGMDPVQLRAYAEQLMRRRQAEGTPYIFCKPVSVLSGAFDPIVIPPFARQPDWELELVVVIGAPARHVRREDALAHVAGYTIANDISNRDQIFTKGDMKALGTDWFLGKSCPTYLPIGPYIVPASQVADPQDLRIELKLNGQTMQDESTSDMIFGVARLIEHISSVVPLMSGDIVCTGSPAGNGTHYGRFLQAGDVVDAAITSLGRSAPPSSRKETDMAIIGIETVLYGVDDVAECTRYFVDFGLPLFEGSDKHAHFRARPEGSNVLIRHIGDAAIPKSKLVGTGVCEVIWGVDRQDSLDRLVDGLLRDREVRVDADGTAHCLTDDGLAIGLRLYTKTPVHSSPDPVNSPGNLNRISQQRKWKVRARPKCILHVVFQTPDTEKSWRFYRDRLGFKLSDIQKGFGVFGRGDGADDHHNIYFLNAHLPFPGLDGNHRFDHVNYGVEDVDEVMIGANYMQRQGWPKSEWGLGRHRIASSIFMYLPCPTGGQAEYGADSDHLDDSWVPRVWNPMFGFFSFIHNMAPFMMDAAPWEWDYAPGYTPDAKAAPQLPDKAHPEAAHPPADPGPPQAPGFS